MNRPIPELTEKAIARFWGYVDKSGDCWIWRSYSWSRGYGGFKFRGMHYLAHRVSYSLSNGKFGQEGCVLHKCDTPKCVNPDHLYLGDQMQNMADASARKRFPGGIDKPLGWKKLSPESIREIRILRKDGAGYPEISKKFDITPGMVGHILFGRAWAWVS